MIELYDYNMLPIDEVAKKINIDKDVLYHYGKYIAKVPYDYYPYNVKEGTKAEKAKLVLVTAMTPTKSGEGKTLTSVGISMALNKLGKKTVACLRQGSLGPVFGMKGCAIGSGNSTVLPTEELAMGFTGDLDAITNANNLLSAMIDNHIYQGNELNIDSNNILWKRCVDTCDRSLKTVKTGWTKKGVNTELESHFDITAASEIMTILVMSQSLDELRERLGNITVAYDLDGNPVYSRQLNCVGSLLAILKNAFNPNLVQTCEGTPVLVHGGPFANISCGTNTIVNTKLGMRLGDYVVTEAGFAADLGAEKFLDIKCRQAEIEPDCVVLVTTIKALKHHGGSDEDIPNIDAVSFGTDNLVRHINNLQVTFNRKVVVALNRFPNDTTDEINVVRNLCELMDVDFSVSTAFSDGSDGVIDLANKVISNCESDYKPLTYAYELDDDVVTKIVKVAEKIYGTSVVDISEEALNKIKKIEELGYGNLPICIAKTQYSLSDNPKLLNRPEGWNLQVRDVELKSGSGMIVVICGTIMTMPGLPKVPNAEQIDVIDGKIVGLS